MLSVNFDPSDLTIQRNLNSATCGISSAIERMSTGYKVNRAADDAAGMFVASNLNAALRGLKQAQNNTNNGISLINTASGYLNNMTDILERMRDLAVQGANGIYDIDSREAMQLEADSLVSELLQIKNIASFNGKQLFNWKVKSEEISSFSAPPPKP